MRIGSLIIQDSTLIGGAVISQHYYTCMAANSAPLLAPKIIPLLYAYIHKKQQTANWPMTSAGRKPQLTIEVEELGDQYNSKFKGYIDYPHEELAESHPAQDHPYSPPGHLYPHEHPYAQRGYELTAGVASSKIHMSQASQRSNYSDASDRSALLERAEQIMLESRLEQNVKSLSRNKYNAIGDSRAGSGAKHPQGLYQVEFVNSGEAGDKKMLGRSKSSSSINSDSSRAKILQEIADKLKRVDKSADKQLLENRSFMGNSRASRQSRANTEMDFDSKSKVERIKELKEQMTKTRAGKLEHLMKGIKKSNREACKVVYTIKKTTTGSFQKSKQMKDKIHEETKKTVTNSISSGKKIYAQEQAYENAGLKRLAQQLQQVRLQLKEVKNKNEELLQLSHSRAHEASSRTAHGQTQSQSSRLTHQIENLEFDLASNASTSQKLHSPLVSSPFTKVNPVYLNYDYMRPINAVQHQVVMQVQPCFACGCTCRTRMGILK